ncbi:MAG: carboxy terminal-processing peptidase [Deltaproteobacteria bacterium]|nr:carboxy terminal-processing peptidase [Deltaproteobacteria bacterium]
MKIINFSFLPFLLLLLVVFSPLRSSADTSASTIDRKRDSLIGYMLSKQLPSLHFSKKKMDDGQAEAAFKLYIKQLDYQKRFLLQGDVDQLDSFADYIDDNIKSGRISLPDAGYDILSEKIMLVEKMVEEMLEDNTVHHGKDLSVGIFHVTKEESYETDPENLHYAKTLDELKNRWRKILKAQIISRYLDLQEENKAEKDQKQKKNEDKLLQEAVAKVAKRNKNFFHRLHQETLQDHYDRFFNAVTRAFGPHTNYIPPASKEDFDINMRGSLEGIGALLREEDGFIKVVRIIPGSASARQGQLKAEDIILQVAQQDEEPVDITDMRLRDAVRLIRGPKGEEVRLKVRRGDGSTQVIPIIRDVVQIEETFVKSAVIDSDDGKRMGYILIPSFYRDFQGTRNGAHGRNSTDDTRREIIKLKKKNIDGLILDLRDNGGGALVDAVDIAGLFFSSGPVVQVKNSFGDKRILSDTDETIFYDGPLVVLVNKFSASASEIVAAALQDYGRAVVVGGDHTHGKGTVQTIIDLNEQIPLLQFKKYDDLGALKITIQKFYRVTGGSTQYKGVEPDIILPTLLDHLKSGERYLDYSMPWDSIEPVEFTPYSGMKFDLDALRKESLAQAAKDEGLKVIKIETEKAKKRSDETRIVISIDDMRKKREEANLVREKVGAHYRKYRKDMSEDEGQEKKNSDEAMSRETWLKDVNDDPYVREAVNIIEDIRQQNGQ